MKNFLHPISTLIVLMSCSATVMAQNSINPDRITDKNRSGISLRFIDNIEIVPESEIKITEAPEIETSVKPAHAHIPKTSPVVSQIEDCSLLQFKYATMIDVAVEDIANIDLYRFVDDWWGTRYRLGGKDKSGIDCSAFAGKLITEIYGLELPRTAREQFFACEKLANEDLAEGDLVFFNTRGGISHVGVYLGNNYFVHSSVHGGVTISSLDEPYYRQRLVCGGRVQ